MSQLTDFFMLSSNRQRPDLRTCKACGAAAYTNESFCACCGASLADPKRQCPSCAREIAHSIANFCPHCGQDLLKQTEKEKAYRNKSG